MPKHIRLLHESDSDDVQWKHEEITALFAPCPEGLEAAREQMKTRFRTTSTRKAPVDIVLCIGPLKPAETYSTIRVVQRPADLLDDRVPSTFDVARPSLEELKKRRSRWLFKQRTGRKRPGETKEQIDYKVNTLSSEIESIQSSLQEQAEASKEAWPGSSWPGLYPTADDLAQKSS